MTRQINLYTHDFNIGEEVHYCFFDRSKYLAELSKYLLLSLPFGSWRFNRGQILISKEVFTQNKKDWGRVVYLCDTGEDGTPATFWHVTSKTEQSGYIVFNIVKDLWGTNYPYASLKELRISRCNRDVGNGYLDEIKEVDGNEHYKAIKLLDPLSNYIVVMLISVVMSTTTMFGNNPLNQTLMFGIPLNEIYSKLNASPWDKLDPVDKVRFLVGGLRSAKNSEGGSGSTDIAVLRCWIVPRELVSLSSTSINQLNGTSFVNPTGYDFKNVALVNPTQGYMSFDMADFIGNANEWYYNYKLAFGPWGHEMALTRFTNDTKVYVRSFVGSSDVKIELVQGSNVLDVSSSFELNLNVNNQLGTNAEQLQKVVSKLVAIVGAGAIGYAKGGVGGAVLAGATTAIASIEHPKATSPASTNGDGATSFFGGNANGVLYPWVLKGYKSLADEMKNAYFNGANFDVRNNDLNGIQNEKHLGANSYEEHSTFIQCSSLEVSLVDRETSDFISQEFKRGIKYKYLM